MTFYTEFLKSRDTSSHVLPTTKLLARVEAFNFQYQKIILKKPSLEELISCRNEGVTLFFMLFFRYNLFLSPFPTRESAKLQDELIRIVEVLAEIHFLLNKKQSNAISSKLMIDWFSFYLVLRKISEKPVSPHPDKNIGVEKLMVNAFWDGLDLKLHLYLLKLSPSQNIATRILMLYEKLKKPKEAFDFLRSHESLISSDEYKNKSDLYVSDQISLREKLMAMAKPSGNPVHRDLIDSIEIYKSLGEIDVVIPLLEKVGLWGRQSQNEEVVFYVSCQYFLLEKSDKAREIIRNVKNINYFLCQFIVDSSVPLKNVANKFVNHPCDNFMLAIDFFLENYIPPKEIESNFRCVTAKSAYHNEHHSCFRIVFDTSPREALLYDGERMSMVHRVIVDNNWPWLTFLNEINFPLVLQVTDDMPLMAIRDSKKKPPLICKVIDDSDTDNGLWVKPPMLTSKASLLIKLFESNGHHILLVGGAIRDSQLGIEPRDYDFVTTATVDEVKVLCGQQCIEMGHENRSIRVTIGNEEFDFTFIPKFEDNTELKTILRNDASKRDFSVNAIFFDPREDVFYDFFDGFFDIDKRFLKLINKLTGLILLRSIRYAEKLEFSFDRRLRKAFFEEQNLIYQIHKNRLIEETKKMGVKNLKEYGLLATVELILGKDMPDVNLDTLHNSFEDSYDLTPLFSSTSPSP